MYLVIYPHNGLKKLVNIIRS